MTRLAAVERRASHSAVSSAVPPESRGVRNFIPLKSVKNWGIQVFLFEFLETIPPQPYASGEYAARYKCTQTGREKQNRIEVYGE